MPSLSSARVRGCAFSDGGAAEGVEINTSDAPLQPANPTAMRGIANVQPLAGELVPQATSTSLAVRRSLAAGTMASRSILRTTEFLFRTRAWRAIVEAAASKQTRALARGIWTSGRIATLADSESMPESLTKRRSAPALTRSISFPVAMVPGVMAAAILRNRAASAAARRSTSVIFPVRTAEPSRRRVVREETAQRWPASVRTFCPSLKPSSYMSPSKVSENPATVVVSPPGVETLSPTTSSRFSAHPVGNLSTTGATDHCQTEAHRFRGQVGGSVGVGADHRADRLQHGRRRGP